MTSGGDDSCTSRRSIVYIELDEESFSRHRPEIVHERAVAIFDLLEDNYFELKGDVYQSGPYHLKLSRLQDQLIYDVQTTKGTTIRKLRLAIKPFRTVIKDYLIVCESYFDAIKTQRPAQIEAIDMGRRALHNEGADMLTERLEAHVNLDPNTARRLFTLLCVLHVRV